MGTNNNNERAAKNNKQQQQKKSRELYYRSVVADSSGKKQKNKCTRALGRMGTGFLTYASRRRQRKYADPVAATL